MDERETEKQDAPSEDQAGTLSHPLNQSFIYQDETCDNDFILNELAVPYLKVDERMYPIKWNEHFLVIANILESDLLHKLQDKGMETDHSLLLLCVDLIRQVLSTGEKQIENYEDENSLLHIVAIPYHKDQSVFLMIDDLSLQKQYDHLLTYYHQIESASHLSTGVAHELRNPLSVIKGFLQLSNLTGDFHKYYDTIMSEINRMNGIIEDFLSVLRKRIESDLQSPAAIMDSLLEIMKAECSLNNVELKLDITKTSKVVYVNEAMIKQVMLNLLRNSIEAFDETMKNRVLRIDSMIEDNHYVIYVTDNGRGMSESILNQIGKPFFTTKERGTGIGIPLCKRLIEDQGGTFQIKSTYNVGTTVIISLPLEEPK